MSESNRLLEPREPRGAGNEPKRERPHGEWHSILLRAGSWLRHQLDFLDRLFEDAQRGEGHAQMRHDYAVRNARQLIALLERRALELQHSKTDRAALAGLFNEVALRLTDQFKVTGAGD